MSAIRSLPGRINLESTAITRRRYQRIAQYYDVMCLIPERLFQPWRSQLWSLITGPQVLEVGVGTGRNIEFYQEGVRITAIVSPDQADTAEVGIVVEDRYQNQGLGSYLIRLLIDYAREQGIRAFSGTVSLQNQRILRFITRSGLPAERKLYQGVWEICVDLQGTDGNL